MSSLRRLAKDHATLRKALPPNYLFADDEVGSSLPDDLTQLVIYLTGANGTPYEQGLWNLQLKIPTDYPKNPPKAIFKTRIFHPNVEEETGLVCLETLKRDWDPKLTLKDILITISCLLIHPNPDSALNAKAGALIQEDYVGFARQAKLMTSIHAPIPKHLRVSVNDAKRRGENDAIPSSTQLLSESSLLDDQKENKSKEDIEFCQRKEQSAKRPIQEVSTLGEAEENATFQSAITTDQKLDIETGEESCRKSPKHNHSESTNSRNSPTLEDTDKENDTTDPRTQMKSVTLPAARGAGLTNRMALRKVSNPGSGTMKNQPRIGIRRL